LSYDKTLQQESRAAVRKPRDVEAVFFCLKFANHTNSSI